MDFYVSWSHSDPFYQLYDNQCSMLISPTSVTSVWSLKRFSRLPYQIMLDSGSYSYIVNQLPLPSPRQVFERQLFILAESKVPALICALDVPILQKQMSVAERNKAIDKTIGNAWELKILLAEYSKRYKSGKFLWPCVEAIAIVQGYDVQSLKYCAKRLLELGYQRFGIGSMAHLYHTEEIRKRVEAVYSVLGSGLHVFGVSAIETMKVLREIGVTSVDSARPIKAAIYNEIIFSAPYRRYGIAGSTFRPGQRKFSEMKLVERLDLECSCPICGGYTNNDILKLGRRKELLLRAVHNYYHIKKMIAD